VTCPCKARTAETCPTPLFYQKCFVYFLPSFRTLNENFKIWGDERSTPGLCQLETVDFNFHSSDNHFYSIRRLFDGKMEIPAEFLSIKRDGDDFRGVRNPSIYVWEKREIIALLVKRQRDEISKQY